MRKISKEELISELRECFEKHGQVSRRIFNEDSEFSSGKTIYNKFGSFSEGCEKANVPHYNKPQSKDKVEITCLGCGNKREVYPYRVEKEFPDKTSQTCKNCMDKREKVSCSWCGEEIIRHNYQLERSENFFCDDKCYGSWRSENVVGENHPRYDGGPVLEMGRNWSAIREEVIERDGEECIKCGISREEHIEKFNRDINVHHIMPRKEFIEAENKNVDDANEMNNLKTLCIPCHRVEESS